MWAKAWLKLQSLKREHGQDLAEYAMLMALIAIVAAVGITALGQNIYGTFYNKFIGYFNTLGGY